MRIVFGDGKIAVSTALQEEHPLLILEEKGTGTVGQAVPNRRAGMKVPIEELEAALLIMEFKSVRAIDVVVEQLTALKEHLLREEEKPLRTAIEFAEEDEDEENQGY
jgi:hypothetical protein